MFAIYVNGIDSEAFYHFSEAIKRAFEISKCFDVERVEIVSNLTGEVLFIFADGALKYVSSAVVYDV